MTILVSGAHGNLGAAILRRLPTAQGASRTPDAGMRYLDFDYPDAMDLTGVHVLVMISAGRGEDDEVIGRHQAVLEAAHRDGVQHVIYTSLAGAGDHIALALAHRVTEQLVQASGMRWTILRNGMYAELFGSMLSWSPGGELESPFGDGALAAVAREDLAEVAAIVARNPAVHDRKIYDLVGTPITSADVAAHVGAPHRSIDLGEYRRRLSASGMLLPVQIPFAISIASNVKHGFMAGTGPDLVDLLGQPATPTLDIAANAIPRP